MDRIHYLIYQIQHKDSGKLYIGKHQTTDPNDGYMGSGKRLRYALKKYGRDAFIKTILHDFTTEQDMNDMEKALVTEDFCRRKDTYNICEGGKGGFGYVNRSGLSGRERGMIHSKSRWNDPEFRAKRLHRIHQMSQSSEFRSRVSVATSAALRKKYQTEPHPWEGRRHTADTIRKMRLARQHNPPIGCKNGRYGSMWITNGTTSRVILKTDVIPSGWCKGRK